MSDTQVTGSQHLARLDAASEAALEDVWNTVYSELVKLQLRIRANEEALRALGGQDFIESWVGREQEMLALKPTFISTRREGWEEAYTKLKQTHSGVLGLNKTLDRLFGKEIDGKTIAAYAGVGLGILGLGLAAYYATRKKR